MNTDALLEAVIDRIIPRDDDPGALDLGTPRFVRGILASEPRDGALIEAGLARLAETDFINADAAGRDALLLTIEHESWFERLVTITSEGFYADPGNGGNDGARSWAMIGYEHRLPDGPDGPPAKGGRP